MSMEQLANDFRNVPEDDKLVMAYLASGNSLWDLLRMIVTEMSAAQKQEILDDIQEQNDEDDGATEMYKNIYASLGDSINTPVAG